jgi:hypothetical protein
VKINHKTTKKTEKLVFFLLFAYFSVTLRQNEKRRKIRANSGAFQSADA